ncbi:MAG: ABC transporter ATP-binding protein [Alphaproteobacteria bacterium]|nr:ABC transporter ATP-binding protein [Alphaproteobacteria bacterium]MCB9793556.1 ABC transporter ATP-binding protein [Alphaproteobacteria bacterium]
MIRTEGIAKRYAGFQALQPLDLEVEDGEVFGFLGPNGAGKTTTIRILSGVLPPSEGRVFIDGVDMAVDPVSAKSRIGFIPDRPYLYEKLTAREMLAFIGGLYGMSEADIRAKGDALLEFHGLGEFADRLIEGFSHGMKQRLTLSAALLHEPRLLIVDEPMVGLDPKGHKQIKDVFRQIAASGRTVFLSTHSLDVAQEVCDRLAIIHKGRIVAKGTYEELRARRGPDAADLEEVFLRILDEESQRPEQG